MNSRNNHWKFLLTNFIINWKKFLFRKNKQKISVNMLRNEWKSYVRLLEPMASPRSWHISQTSCLVEGQIGHPPKKAPEFWTQQKKEIEQRNEKVLKVRLEVNWKSPQTFIHESSSLQKIVQTIRSSTERKNWTAWFKQSQTSFYCQHGWIFERKR